MATSPMVRALVNFLRANPQVLILLVICLVLGLGTFIAVLISLAQNSNGSLQGEPSGLILVAVRALA